MLRIGLFGGVRAVAGDGRPVAVGSAKCQTLLAALALSPGSAVPVSRLVDLVWGQQPPRTAEKTLQWYVTRLRKALGPETIVRSGAAYGLNVEAGAVDVARFSRRLEAGDVEGALAEWTGTPLAGLVAPGMTATVDGLVEQWLGATEAHLGRQIETDPQAAIGPLTELTASHPFREGLWALRMTALYRMGRQADALAAFHEARQHLVEHLGVEPGPRLRELESAILRQDQELRGSGDHPPSQAEGARRGNLPVRLGRLIGREEDLEAIGDALGSGPVVTLVGPGGVGKTRLALAAARTSGIDRAGGVWLAELAEVASPEDVPRAVADVLGVRETPGRTLTRSIAAFLDSRAALLVLDNCEHVIDGAARLAQAIAEHCAEVRVLATSRERLGVSGEQLFTVSPLEPAGPGTELFTERALAVSRTFDPDAARDDVEEICRRVDGVPLAIELAAARTRTLAPADLLARLDDQLRLLTSRRSPTERHRTLRATIQWSYDLLTPPEQQLFQRLSIFAGTFDLAAAEQVTADTAAGDADVADLLDSLVDRSMLTVEPGPFGRRFRLLETMRQFAAEHLLERGHTDPTAQRHAHWCLDQVTHIHRLLTSPAEIEGVARLRELWPNLRAAVDRACIRHDHKVADALVRPIAAEIVLRGRHEIGDWGERVLAITPPDDEGLVAFWLSWAAQRYAQSGDLGAYERLARRLGEPDHPLTRYTRAYLHRQGEALRECLPDVVADLRRRGEDHLAGLMRINTAGMLMGIGRFQEVDEFVSALADRYRAHGPPTLLNWTLATLGYSALFQGDPARADRLFTESASVDVPGQTLSADKTIQARAAFRRGQRPRAFRILHSYVDELLDADDVAAATIVAIEFVNLMAAVDRLPDAARILDYLRTTNDFGALAAKTLVADAASKIAAGATPAPDPEQAPVQHLDDRQALAYMRDVLAWLA